MIVNLKLNRTFQLMIALDISVVMLMIIFLVGQPITTDRFNLIMSSTTSLGAILGFNALTFKAIKAEIKINQVLGDVDVKNSIARMSKALDEFEALMQMPEIKLIAEVLAAKVLVEPPTITTENPKEVGKK